jgi:hypothetical protein
MASITLAGTLLDPDSSIAIGDQIRFTHQSTTGQTISSAVSLLTVTVLGTYSINLQYGLILVEYKDVKSTQFKNLGVVTVNAANPATSIPELLNAVVPVSSSELIALQAVLADSIAAKNAAVVAKDAAEAALAGIPTYGTAATRDVTTSSTDTTAGRLMKVNDFGIGATSVGFTDWNAIPQQFNGLLSVSASAANRPAGLTSGFYHVVKFGDANESFIAKKVNSLEVFVLSRTAGGTTFIFHGLLFHSGNTNLNVFSANGSNDVLAVGFAVTTSIARFYLPIDLLTSPSSITTVSTFSVIRNVNDSIASGLSTITLGGISSNKLAVVFISGLSNLIEGENLSLISDTTSSKITVNS